MIFANPLPDVAGILFVDARSASSTLFGVSIVSIFQHGGPHNGVWSNSWPSFPYLVANSIGIVLACLGTSTNGISCPLLWSDVVVLCC